MVRCSRTTCNSVHELEQDAAMAGESRHIKLSAGQGQKLSNVAGSVLGVRGKIVLGTDPIGSYKGFHELSDAMKMVSWVMKIYRPTRTLVQGP